MPNEIVKKVRPAFKDKRGEIANILDQKISHAAIITSKKGSVRANHYHPKQIQYEYLISGSYESVSKNLRKKNSGNERIIVKPGDLVITPPMVAHAMRFIKDSVMLNFTTGKQESKNFSEHTRKYKLI